MDAAAQSDQADSARDVNAQIFSVACVSALLFAARVTAISARALILATFMRKNNLAQE